MTVRVLHITDASSGGVLTSVATLARAQAADEGFNGASFAYVPRFDTPSPEALATMFGAGVAVSQISATTSALRLVTLAKFAFSALNSDVFDVVHVHSSRAGFVVRVAAFVLRRADRVVYSPHAFAFDQRGNAKTKRRLFLVLERLGCRLDPRLVLVSETERKVALAALVEPRTAVLPNAVDTGLLDRVVRNRSVDEVVRICHVGRIVDQKAPEQFAQVVSVAQAKDSLQVEVYWLGDGQRERLNSAWSPIDVLGWLSPEEMRAKLKNCDILVFTSIGEGMPMAVLEAQALGVVVIASRVTGVTDLIEDRATGRLADSASEMASILVELIKDPIERSRLALAARENCVSEHDISRLARRSLHIYRELCFRA